MKAASHLFSEHLMSPQVFLMVFNVVLSLDFCVSSNLSCMLYSYDKYTHVCSKIYIYIAFLLRVESLTVEWHVFLPGSIRICLKIHSTVFFNFYKQIHNERMTNININVMIMVFHATFNNITVLSWRSVFLMEETGVSEES